MVLDRAQFLRITRRLSAAEGYVELGMVQHALDCLEDLGALGPFEPAVQMLRGKVLWLQHRYDDAAAALEMAAPKIRPPHNREVWLALSIYYRQTGDIAQAIQNLAQARGARIPAPRPNSA